MDLNWFCHCCLSDNEPNTKKCKVCGRDEDYVEEGYEYPLLGDGNKVFRASQVKSLVKDVYEVDDNNWTALHNACFIGNVDMVKELLNLGADTLAVTIHGQTCLHLCIMSGYISILKILFKHPHKIDAKTTCESLTALHLACQLGRKEMVEMLVDKGADVNAKNIIERTPLHLAGKAGRADMGMFLLENGAKIGALDSHGWGCRQVAELDGNYDFAEMIVRYQMTDKQSTMKKLPDLEYHGDLWTDLVVSHADKKYQYHRSLQQEERVQRDIEHAKKVIKTNSMVQHLIDNNRTDHASTDLQGVSDMFYLKHKGVEKPRDHTYDVAGGNGNAIGNGNGGISDASSISVNSRSLNLLPTTSTTNSASISRLTTPRHGSVNGTDSGSSTPSTNPNKYGLIRTHSNSSSSTTGIGIGFKANLRKSSSGRNAISSAGKNTLM